MSLHIVANGMTSGQRMKKQKKEPELEDPDSPPKWFNETSMNNLNDVYQVVRSNPTTTYIHSAANFVLELANSRVF
jgi:hypothetical protein